MYNCPPWSPVNTTPGNTCKYWAKSGSPPTDGICVICFGVTFTAETLVSVFASVLSAVISTSLMLTDF